MDLVGNKNRKVNPSSSSSAAVVVSDEGVRHVVVLLTRGMEARAIAHSGSVDVRGDGGNGPLVAFTAETTQSDESLAAAVSESGWNRERGGDDGEEDPCPLLQENEELKKRRRRGSR